jgi:predicted HAD superfamily Cof-like phosphohydrolase
MISANHIRNLVNQHRILSYEFAKHEACGTGIILTFYPEIDFAVRSDTLKKEQKEKLEQYEMLRGQVYFNKGCDCTRQGVAKISYEILSGYLNTMLEESAQEWLADLVGKSKKVSLDHIIQVVKEEVKMPVEEKVALFDGLAGAIDDVARFMRACDQTILYEPEIPDAETKALRKRLIEGEVIRELLPAIDNDDMVEIADGIADSIYVLIGLGLAYGIPSSFIWKAVQEKNMAKVDKETGKVIKDEGGKVLKPEGWAPPDIESVLVEHGWKKPE